MRFTGILKSWNDDRGFGFIAPTEGGQDIFVHISDCPQGRRPELQEMLTFEIALNPQRKKKAVNVRYSEAAANGASRQHGRAAREREPEPPGRFTVGVIALAIVAAIGWYGYRQYGGRPGAAAAVATPAPLQLPQEAGSRAPSPFACDGRTSCSQMTSCAEATFFLKNCPGVKMDGNHDGVPCEQQWCR